MTNSAAGVSLDSVRDLGRFTGARLVLEILQRLLGLQPLALEPPELGLDPRPLDEVVRQTLLVQRLVEGRVREGRVELIASPRSPLNLTLEHSRPLGERLPFSPPLGRVAPPGLAGARRR